MEEGRVYARADMRKQPRDRGAPKCGIKLALDLPFACAPRLRKPGALHERCPHSIDASGYLRGPCTGLYARSRAFEAKSADVERSRSDGVDTACGAERIGGCRSGF